LSKSFLSSVSTRSSAVSSLQEHEAIVNQGVTYRGFTIYHDGNEFVAEPVVSDGENFEIGASDRARLFSAIDELHVHLDAASRIDQDVSVPAWYQTWLNDGADGRIRIHACGGHESIAPSRSWWGLGKLLAGALVCSAAFMFAPKLDINGDGALDREDFSSMVEKVYLKYPPKSSIHHIRWGQRVYDVSLKPAPDDDVDFDADDVLIKGVSLKQASSPPTTPTMSYVPYMPTRD
jgi:hypothetical protein